MQFAYTVRREDAVTAVRCCEDEQVAKLFDGFRMDDRYPRAAGEANLKAVKRPKTVQVFQGSRKLLGGHATAS